MSIKIGRFWVVYESVTMKSTNPEFLSIDKEDIMKYMKNNPMPADNEYSEVDLVYDITISSGMWSLPDNILSETRKYIEELLNELRN